MTWDEPSAAASGRGWLHNDETDVCIGWYLEYSEDGLHRSTHVVELPPLYGWQIEKRKIITCSLARLCVECEPGTVLAAAYPGGPRSEAKSYHWFITIDEAKAWIESMQFEMV